MKDMKWAKDLNIDFRPEGKVKRIYIDGEKSPYYLAKVKGEAMYSDGSNSADDYRQFWADGAGFNKHTRDHVKDAVAFFRRNDENWQNRRTGRNISKESAD